MLKDAVKYVSSDRGHTFIKTVRHLREQTVLRSHSPSPSLSTHFSKDSLLESRFGTSFNSAAANRGCHSQSVCVSHNPQGRRGLQRRPSGGFTSSKMPQVTKGQRKKWHFLFTVGIYAIMTPIGIGLGIALQLAVFNEAVKDILTALLESMACGTFMYVTFLEVSLPV